MNLQDQAQQTIQSIMINFNQFEPLIKTYQPFIIGTGIFLALFLTLKLIQSRRRQIQNRLATTHSSEPKHLLTDSDMEMLAGEDVVSTQFDLARAYIEMGKKHLAKSILHHISKSGNSAQQQEAHRLMTTL